MRFSTRDQRSLWIGTYPQGTPGSGEGIWRVSLNVATGRFISAELAARATAASFLATAPDGKTLYAVGETDVGSVSAFDICAEPPWLQRRGRPVASGGSLPCHLLAAGGKVWVAHYGDGVFSVVSVSDGGELLPDPQCFPHRGSGPDRVRQERSHGHYVVPIAGRPVVVDLGTDELRDHGDPAGPSTILAALPPGTGPRHAAVLGGGALVVTGELDPALFVLAPCGAGLAVIARYELGDAASEPRPYPSHVEVTPDGRHVLVAVRGTDILAVFAVDRSSAIPRLDRRADIATGGCWPRHFAILARSPASRNLVVVAHERSGNLALVSIDRAGMGELLDVLDVPAPACVVAY